MATAKYKEVQTNESGDTTNTKTTSTEETLKKTEEADVNNTKKVTRKPAEKKTTASRAVKAADKLTEEKKPEEKKTEEVKTAKPAAKAAAKATAKPAAKPAAKAAAKRGPAKKKELKTSMNVQYAGKSYSQEDLIKIAKDVWKYDLKKKAGDLANIELYIKPEEDVVYYVFNETEEGSFTI